MQGRHLVRHVLDWSFLAQALYGNFVLADSRLHRRHQAVIDEKAVRLFGVLLYARDPPRLVGIVQVEPARDWRPRQKRSASFVRSLAEDDRSRLSMVCADEPDVIRGRTAQDFSALPGDRRD